MPIYEYQCLKCNNVFEKIVLTNDPKVICPKCESNAIEKLLSSYQFKINGFRADNGYSRKNYQTGEEIISKGPEQSITDMKFGMGE